MYLSSRRPGPILLVAIGVVGCSMAHAASPPTAHFSEGQSVVPSSELNSPQGVAVDGSGNVYIADTGNSRVLKETLSRGSYTEITIASSAPFNLAGVAADASGDVYIAAATSNLVLKETLAGGIYTTSGVASNGLNSPYGVAVDASGNVYIADRLNNRVLKETLAGGVYTESTIASSGLYLPCGVAVDAHGNVYFADHSGSSSVLKETPAGGSYTQSTIASFAGGPSVYPTGVAVDARGNNIYFADAYNNRVVKLQTSTVDFESVNVGSTSPTIPLTFSFDTGGTLGSTAVLTQGAAGLDFADAGTGSCAARTAYVSGDTCSIDVTLNPRFPGVSLGAAELLDSSGNILATASLTGTGVGPQVSFLPGATQTTILSGVAYAFGVAVDASGNVFVDDDTGSVYKETLQRNGSYIQSQIASGLSVPAGIAVDGSGNVYVADTLFVYKETLSNGGYAQSTIVSGSDNLVGLAVDEYGNLYAVGSGSGNVYKETLQGNGSYMQTQIGNAGAGLTGVAVDGSGNVYVSNRNSGELYEETRQGDGSYVQTMLAGGLVGPQSVAVDGGGNLYIAGSALTEPYSGEVYKEALQSDGTYIQTTVADGPTGLWWVAVDGLGNLYLSQYTASSNVSMIDVANPSPLSFSSTKVGSTSTDSPETVTLSNVGNAALAVPALGLATNPSISTSFTLGDATTCPEVSSSGTAGSVAAGGSCVYAIDFVPGAGGSISGSLVLTDNNQNTIAPGYTTQSVAMSGTGVAPSATRTTVSVSPNPVTVGQPVMLTATVIDTATSATSPWGGGVTFSDSVGGVMVSLNGGAAVPLNGGTATLTFSPSVAGAHTITANYADGCGCFAGSSGQASLTAAAGPVVPALSFAPIAPQSYGNAPFAVSASSASSGAVTYTVVSGPATIWGNTVTLTGAGTVVLGASQAASGDYAAATATTSFTVTTGLMLTCSSGGGAAAPGGAAAYHLMLAPGSGATYPDAVTFSATGLPPGASATFSPAKLPAGSRATPVTMTIQTSNPQTAHGEKPFSGGSPGPMALAFLLLPVVGIKPVRRRAAEDAGPAGGAGRGGAVVGRNGVLERLRQQWFHPGF